MAQPILLKIPPEDPRVALRQRLESAPTEHAEALLALYDIVQELHDKGLLELAKGALGSGEKVMKIGVEAANSPEVIQAIRNFMILSKLFASLDPRLLEHLAGAVPKALVEAKEEKPLGLFALLGMLASQDMRRILGIGGARGEVARPRPRPAGQGLSRSPFAPVSARAYRSGFPGPPARKPLTEWRAHHDTENHCRSFGRNTHRRRSQTHLRRGRRFVERVPRVHGPPPGRNRVDPRAPRGSRRVRRRGAGAPHGRARRLRRKLRAGQCSPGERPLRLSSQPRAGAGHRRAHPKQRNRQAPTFRRRMPRRFSAGAAIIPSWCRRPRRCPACWRLPSRLR